MRAPIRSEEGLKKEEHYAAVKAIVGELTDLGGLSMDDYKVYQKYTGTPEAVAKKILEARAARAANA